MKNYRTNLAAICGLWLHYKQAPSFSNHIAVEYSHYINSSYCSVIYVFELVAFSLLPQYVVVFCHIMTACCVL